MQADELDILGALSNLLRTVKETNKLNTIPLDQWPTYAATLNIIDENEEKVYQGQVAEEGDTSKEPLWKPLSKVLYKCDCSLA